MGNTIIPGLGIITGIIPPIAVFIWLYLQDKGKGEAVTKIVKHLDDPSRVEELLTLFYARKKEPIDYRCGGVITLFVVVGIYLLGTTSFGSFF